MVTAEGGKSQLVSTDLHGQDKRVHANGELVSDYEISPDGRMLAFRQNYDAYVTPLMPGGQDVSLGIKSSALPVTRVRSEEHTSELKSLMRISYAVFG